MDETSSSFSPKRILLVAVPVAIITALGMQLWGTSMQQSAQAAMQKNILSNLLPDVVKANDAFTFTDANGDLVADTPAELQSPEELVFSYIATETEDGESPDLSPWQEQLDAIGQATGKPVTTTHFQKVSDQLEALRAGQVHLIGMATGAAPLAVRSAGFVPLCSMADVEGRVGYNMVLLTAAGSPLKELADVKGRKMVFVRPTSNSGFKAALVQVYEQAKLLPERDYSWSFSLSHETSVRAVLDGEADAAPVASDILAKMVEQDEVKEEDYRVLYESEDFPPAVLGCAHNLPAELVGAIKKSLTEFEWSGTGLEELLGPMGAARFKSVDYKNDWANIRRIDTMVEQLAEMN